jgi:hypothetical protein
MIETMLCGCVIMYDDSINEWVNLVRCQLCKEEEE